MRGGLCFAGEAGVWAARGAGALMQNETLRGLWIRRDGEVYRSGRQKNKATCRPARCLFYLKLGIGPPPVANSYPPFGYTAIQLANVRPALFPSANPVA